MRYERHYIQYNDLVFDYYDMISEDDTTIKYKYDSEEYTFRHGDYVAHKRRGMLADSGSVSMTITLEMKKIPCDVRPYYMDFAISQLNQQGKLWAVQNNRIIWAYAFVDEIEYIHDVRRNTMQLDVSFVIPEGIWHKADLQKTFLVPYNRCDFMDCYDYHDIQPCRTGDCCDCIPTGTFTVGGDYIGTAVIGTSKIGGEARTITLPREDEECGCCDCLEKDMALCYHMDELQDFYSCHSDYRIVYDCAMAKAFFDLGEEHLGQKFCTCDGVIAGQLYSDTNVPTEGVKITLHGKVTDPIIEINGNKNIIKGSYDGYLVIYPDGSVYTTSGNCPECLQSISVWEIPKGNDYGWTIYPGNNRLVIYTGACCGTVCAYIEIDSLA